MQKYVVRFKAEADEGGFGPDQSILVLADRYDSFDSARNIAKDRVKEGYTLSPNFIVETVDTI